jgi:hypothetical protein
MSRIYALSFDDADGFLAEFDPLESFRLDATPSGVINGSNTTFTLPESFIPSGDLAIRVYRNGQRQTLGDDYTVTESGGAGTGFDTIEFAAPCAPKDGSVLRVDYVAA